MRDALIFLVEDSPEVFKALRQYLPLCGYKIVFHVMDLKSAIEIVKSGKLEQKGVNLAIIDGWFPESPENLTTKLYGPDVAKAIRETGLPIKIIAHSSDTFCDFGDVFVPKVGGNIAKAISRL